MKQTQKLRRRVRRSAGDSPLPNAPARRRVLLSSLLGRIDQALGGSA